MLILDLSPIRHTLINKKDNISFYYTVNKYTYNKKIKQILPLIMILHPFALLPFKDMGYSLIFNREYNKSHMEAPLILTLCELFKHRNSIKTYVNNLKYTKIRIDK